MLGFGLIYMCYCSGCGVNPVGKEGDICSKCIMDEWEKRHPFCRKCGDIEVEKEGDMCVGCMAQKGDDADPETAKEVREG